MKREKVLASLTAAALIGAAGWMPVNVWAASGSVNAGPGIAVTETTRGTVQGYEEDGVRVYKGIPYARAERFMPPEPVSPWQGVRLSVDYGPVTPQGSFPAPSTFFWPRLPSTMDEKEALNLNIWVPKDASKNSKKAVMVWFHGGGFSTGSAVDLASYDGKNLAETGDVVVVTVNHRLNVLGHLDLSAYGKEYKYSANAGVMDMVAALQWVHDNIGEFGGDPSNVTIFGQSGGGAKVLTLMATPAAQGFFQKGIVQSGAVEGMGMTLFHPELGHRIAQHTFKNLGLADGDIASLKKVPYEDLLKASDEALQQTAEEFQIPDIMGSGKIALYWAPTMDGDYIPEEPVGEKYPAMAKNIPLLIGSNMTEWETVPEMADPVHYESDNPFTWDEATVKEKMTEKYGDRADKVAAAFQKAYPDHRAGEAVYADTFLRMPARKTAQLKADQEGAPVYSYVFAWNTPVMGGFAMSYHTAEIPFVFHNTEAENTVTGNGKDARAMADVVSRAWTNFARTGSPNGEGVPHWDPYTRSNGAVMILDRNSHMAYHHDDDLMDAIGPKTGDGPTAADMMKQAASR